MWRNLGKAVRLVWQTFGDGSGSYRPDLHYMRGPGPKWHAKYGNLAPRTSPAAASGGRVLRDIAEHRA
jgi:hypothetical protein